MKKRSWALGVYFLILFAPIYWMLITSLKTDTEILSRFTLFPREITFEHYRQIFASAAWRGSFINSLTYASMNVVITLLAAIPAAYAFSRWSFRGSHHLFFWLLTNRMAPAAVFMVPFTELYYALGLFDTHFAVALAHCLFNIPLAVWILEGFMSGIPREIDETAFIDGYRFPRFFWKIFLPLIGPGIGVTAFFCFTFSWVELIIAKAVTLTESKPVVVELTVGIGAEGVKWGLLAAAGTLTIVPGILLVYFVRNYMAKGFALGRVWDMPDWIAHNLDWMYWTWPSALFFIGLALTLVAMTAWDRAAPGAARAGLLPIPTTRGDRLFIGLMGAIGIHFAWLGLVGTPWVGVATLISAAWFFVLGRFG